MNKLIYLNEKSKGKVIEVCDLKIGLPKKPRVGTLGTKKSKKNQKWERTPLPETWDIIPTKDKESFIA